MMEILIFLICSIVFSAIFYLIDTYQHKKTIIDATIILHNDQRYLIRSMAKEINEKYPILSKLALSFAEMDKGYRDTYITKNAKKIDKNKQEKLTIEIENLVNEGDRKAEFIAKWYMMTCVIIHSALVKESIFETEHKTKQISEERYDEIDSINCCIV